LNGKKIKVRKKDSERAEELLGKTNLLVDWIVRNRQVAIGALAGVVLILLGSLGYNWYAHSKDQTALKAYSEARRSLATEAGATAPAPVETLDALARVAEQYQATKIAVLAQMDLGRAYYGRGDYAAALNWFEAALKRAPKADFLSLLAEYHTALCDRELGRIPEAVAKLEAVRERVPATLKREFHWQAALTYELAKDLGKAVENFQRAGEAEGTFPAKALLEERLLANQSALGTAGKS